MRTIRWAGVAALILSLNAACLQAAEVTVKGVHLCCGGCVSAAQDALSEVKGVTDVAGDQNTKVIAFKATDDKTAKAAFDALAKAGFHGAAFIDKKEASFPSINVKKGTTSNSITVTGVHLCCGACVTGVKKALEQVKGVDEMNIDREAKTVTVVGTDIDVNDFFAALYKGGYHGEMAKPAKKS